MSLFSLNVDRPDDTDKIKYKTIGSILGKKKFYQFRNEFKESTGIELDVAVYSRMIVEVSKIDDYDYYELSLHNEPITGRQSEIIKRHANNNEMSLAGYVDSINFVLNDSRVYVS